MIITFNAQTQLVSHVRQTMELLFKDKIRKFMWQSGRYILIVDTDMDEAEVEYMVTRINYAYADVLVLDEVKSQNYVPLDTGA